MIDGHGDPNLSPFFQEAVAALYSVSYQIKFTSKQEQRDFVVPPLQQGYLPTGKHHEIYLSDPRKTAAEKLKTVLRQPVRPA